MYNETLVRRAPSRHLDNIKRHNSTGYNYWTSGWAPVLDLRYAIDQEQQTNTKHRASACCDTEEQLARANQMMDAETRRRHDYVRLNTTIDETKSEPWRGMCHLEAVSYTHLTLPTIYSV